MKKIFTFNVGSSSCKFQIFNEDLTVFGKGLVDKIGIDGTVLKYKNESNEETVVKQNITFDQLTKFLVDFINDNNVVNLEDVYLMVHRVVNGGDVLTENFEVKTKEDLEKLESLNHLAPLHNPFNNKVLRYFFEEYPNAKQVVAFDTAFHSTIEDENFIYPIPYKFYEENHIRKYGAHGSSHAFITEVMEEHLGRPVNFINLHLGNGSSVCAVKDSKSVNTSMGLTPLAGLMMGTRSGDIDPSIVIHMVTKLGYTGEQVDKILTKESGLLGISGVSSDMREIIAAEENGNERANLSRRLAAKRVAHTVAMYLSEFESIDGITITGGIGENDSDFTRMIFDRIRNIKFEIKNEFSNKEQINLITTENSEIPVMIVPTNEELYMAKDGKRIIGEGV